MGVRIAVISKPNYVRSSVDSKQHLLCLRRPFTKRIYLIGMLFLLAACGDFNGSQTSVNTLALDPTAISGQPVPPPPSFNAGADSNPKLLATYVVTDSNLSVYNYVDQNGNFLPSGTTQYEQLSLAVDPKAATLGAYLDA